MLVCTLYIHSEIFIPQELEELRVTQALSTDKKEKDSKDSKKEEKYKIEPYHFADGKQITLRTGRFATIRYY